MNKLWGDDGALDPLIERYTVGDDVSLDLELLPYDAAASRAHARGLARIGLLTTGELGSLEKAFDAFLEEYDLGHITITQRDEDGHTVLERFLTERLGETGKKIHTGRSRNDQALTATRLLTRDRLTEIRARAIRLAWRFLGKAEQHKKVPFPGYTHTRQAMLSSLGHYYGSFVESLIDDVEFMDAISRCADKNPLGSAAGYGVVFPLDRAFTTKTLGFRAIQVNSLYCQASRGKFESAVLEGLWQLTATLGRYAHDMLFFTADELEFFAFPDSLATGSSIMPQKRNLDGLEIARGNVSVVQANHQLIQSLPTKLPSGYNRDLQLTKKPLLESLRLVRDTVEVVRLYVEGAAPNIGAIRRAIGPSIGAADRANELVLRGVSFREAYGLIKQTTNRDENEVASEDWDAILHARKSLGSPGNLGLDDYKTRLDALAGDGALSE